MVWDDSKSISCATMPVWRERWTALKRLAVRQRAAATGVRTNGGERERSLVNRQELLSGMKRRLAKAHGRRLRGVVLYGSEVRGDARPDSDIDVLVLLDGPIDYAQDLRTNIDALYDLVLALERPISAKPVDIAAYEAAAYPLYRNAKAEGVLA